MIPLKKYYENIICYDMISQFNYTNIMQVPRIIKIIIHLTIKESRQDQNAIYVGLFILELISGQKGQITKIKKSISNFKIKTKMIAGCKVTLRRSKMFFFLEKLLYLTLPRIKHFNGLKNQKSTSTGSFTFGLKHIFYFPETRCYIYEFLNSYQSGLEITIVTSAQTTLERDILLESFLIPLNET